MLCEERKLYNYFPKFKTDNSSYEDPMSRPRVTLIGKIKKLKQKSQNEVSSTDIQRQIFMLILEI